MYHQIRRQFSITKEDELTFNFEGKIVKFGITDFEKITGLNCEEMPTLDMHKYNGKFVNKYFNQMSPIRRLVLSEMFMNRESIKKKDRVKLAKLCFLSNIHESILHKWP